MVGTVEIWKAEILTVFFTACGIPLALHRIDDSVFCGRFFLLRVRYVFLLVFLSLSTEFDVVARALNLHEQCVFSERSP